MSKKSDSELFKQGLAVRSEVLGAEYTRMQRSLRARFGANSPVRLVSIAFDRGFVR